MRDAVFEIDCMCEDDDVVNPDSSNGTKPRLFGPLLALTIHKQFVKAHEVCKLTWLASPYELLEAKLEMVPNIVKT